MPCFPKGGRSSALSASSKFLAACLIVAVLPHSADAALPTASLDVYHPSSPTDTLHLTEANFGPLLPMGPRLHARPDPSTVVSMGLALSPADDVLLCNEADGLVNYTDEDGESVARVYTGERAVLVPRGGCTFERKVLSAQRLGASGAVVRNTLESRYNLNATNYTDATTGEEIRDPTYDDILWPRPRHDYDCNYASAQIPKELFSFDPLPYNGAANDPLLTGSADDGNLCAVRNDPVKGGAGAFASPGARCSSQRCLLTGKEDAETGTLEACCAWDIHLEMNGDGSLRQEGAEAVEVPSLFANMAQGTELLGMLEGSGASRPVVGLPVDADGGNNTKTNTFSTSASDGAATGTATIAAEDTGISVTMYRRWYPSPNASSFLLWMLGTFITWIASYLSAAGYRKVHRKAGIAVAEGRLVFRRNNGNNGGDDDGGTVASEDDVADAEELREDVTAEEGVAAGEDIEAGTAAPPPVAAIEHPTVAAAAVSSQRGDGFDQEETDVQGAALADDVDLLGKQSVAAPASAAAGRASLAESGFEDEPAQESASAATTDVEARTAGAGPFPTVAEQQQQTEDQQQPTQQQQRQGGARNDSVPPVPLEAPPETLELNAYHVAAFIIFASVALFVLFFFKIYTVVRVMYGLGTSGAMAQVIFLPSYTYLARGIDWVRVRTGRAGINGDKRKAERTIKGPVCATVTRCGCDEFTYVEIASFLSGYAIGISWLYVGFAYHNPGAEVPFYWVAQDLMGASICVAFLSLIRLNSIKIATLLLVAAFVYDIFFVFITPYIFDGDSVMITVATSGGPPDADPDYCEKYPGDGQCQGGDPLPMLLTIPRVNDYRGGANLLGLGDIVLPGLLLSFAARLDSAGRLVRFCTTAAAGDAVASATEVPDGAASSPMHRLKSCSPKTLLCGSYLTPLTIAYAVGLLMANLAVVLMQKGQPALLYLVPACLGTMVVVGKVRGELHDLWKGPVVLKKADRLEGQLRHVRARGATTPAAAGGGGGGGGNGAGSATPASPAGQGAMEMTRR